VCLEEQLIELRILTFTITSDYNLLRKVNYIEMKEGESEMPFTLIIVGLFVLAVICLIVGFINKKRIFFVASACSFIVSVTLTILIMINLRTM
jgi:phosphatidylserine synthase